MPGNEERGLENLIRGTEELIRDIPAAGAPGSLAGSTEERLAEDVRRQEAQALAGMVEPSAVQSRIETLGVTFGIDWEAVKGCILTCNEERSQVSDAVIARGKTPR